MASVLVLGEVAKGLLAPQTLAALTAAGKIQGASVTVLLCGSGADKVAETAAKVKGVSKVIAAPAASLDYAVAENVTKLLHELQQKHKFSHILASATSQGKNILPRLAAKLDVSPISDIIGVKSDSIFVRPMYAGNAIATVKSSEPVKLLTVRPTAFDKAPTEGGSASVEVLKEIQAPTKGAKWVKEEIAKSDRPELASAVKVVSGGRGLKSAENFKIIYDLADKMKAGVGASRAAVDAGYCPNELQVGQTGKVVAPNLYLAVGISGAIQHLAGMKDSKTIACINKDPEAPIFQVSDYGLEADLFKAVPEMMTKI